MGRVAFECIEYTCDKCHKTEMIGMRHGVDTGGRSSYWHKVLMGSPRTTMERWPEELYFCSTKCLAHYFKDNMLPSI